jgi:geranylgeranyl transferase type-2 subunit beta
MAVSSTTGELQLYVDKHVAYIQSLDTRKDSLDYWLTEHLRLSGVYWGLTALCLMKHPGGLPRDATIAYVKSCQHASGGFGAHPGHDAHMLYTVSAIQILAIEDALDTIDGELVAKWIAGLQQQDSGVFAGDEWGETDTRFLYGAMNALSLLGRLDAIDVDKAVRYVLACQNHDGGFGRAPGAESHAGQIFTCVGALAIAEKLDAVDGDLLSDWLCERQLPNGGLNGRPEKLEDVCYSWWVLSSLAMLERLHWIDGESLARFILRCQDEEGGGIADRPGDMVDVFHTVFGVAGLSLLGYEGLEEVDPVYCMPRAVTKRVLGK